MKLDSSQPFIAILMLNTQFPRVLGDIGNPNSFPFPTKQYVIKDANIDAIVSKDIPSQHILNEFIKSAQKAENDGAKAIVTSCGFLSILQNKLINQVSIPVLCSALNLYPFIQSIIKIKTIGIITANAKKLSNPALQSAGISMEITTISGMENSPYFQSLILKNKAMDISKVNLEQLQSEVNQVGANLLEKNPKVSAIILECTNLAPYQSELSTRTNLPVFSINDGMLLLNNNQL